MSTAVESQQLDSEGVKTFFIPSYFFQVKIEKNVVVELIGSSNECNFFAGEKFDSRKYFVLWKCNLTCSFPPNKSQELSIKR